MDKIKAIISCKVFLAFSARLLVGINEEDKSLVSFRNYEFEYKF